METIKIFLIITQLIGLILLLYIIKLKRGIAKKNNIVGVVVKQISEIETIINTLFDSTKNNTERIDYISEHFPEFKADILTLTNESKDNSEAISKLKIKQKYDVDKLRKNLETISEDINDVKEITSHFSINNNEMVCDFNLIAPDVTATFAEISDVKKND